VGNRDGELELTRVAVGDHILLGGDNMDLTVAHALSAKLQVQGKKPDAIQFGALTHEARKAKELLFADSTLKGVPISVAGRGSNLVGSTLRTELGQEELHSLLIDGFFPRVPFAEKPQVTRRSGLAQVGLLYAQDAGVTRHLAAF